MRHEICFRTAFALALLSATAIPTVAQSSARADVDSVTPPIVAAAERGDIRDVKVALFDGIDPNTRDRFKRTALMYAASEGRADVVDALLSRRANVRLKSFDGYTALIFAAAHGHTGIVHALLQRGANPNDRNADHVPALHFACADGGNAETVEALLAKGARPNQPVADGTTPLMTAARIGKLEIVRTLLEHGARPELQDRNGNTALSLALKSGATETAELLRHALGRE